MIPSLVLSAREEVRECNSLRDGSLGKRWGVGGGGGGGEEKKKKLVLGKMPRKKFHAKEESKKKYAKGKGIWASRIANIILKRA